MTSNNINKGVSKVAILDDHLLIGIGTQNTINQFDGFRVVRTDTDTVKFIAWLELDDTSIDILLLDIHLPGYKVNHIIEHCLRFHPKLKILMYSATDDPKEVMQLMPYNIHGFVKKSSTEEQLREALEKVNKNDYYFDAAFLKDAFLSENKVEDVNDKLHNLTQREIEILECLGDGLTSKEIGEKLYLRSRTVDTHRYNLIKKLEVKNIAGALTLLFKTRLK